MSANQLPIKTALISVSDKSGLIELATALDAQGVRILSTGGTAKAIEKAGLNVTDISEHTGFPEMMDGRVKTLHPTVHGGLLARLDSQEHTDAMKAHNIASIDLLVVNLYPFEQTVAKEGATDEEIIENIDIGGPAMVRSAAKNFEFTSIVTNANDYESIIAELSTNNGSLSYATRKSLAAKAFKRIAEYDVAISNWFESYNAQSDDNGSFPPQALYLQAPKTQELRYGENPHQKAGFYTVANDDRATQFTQLHGKELSYNNIADCDAAFQQVMEFDQPAVSVIKHANPCGVAIADTLSEAYDRALASDPVSAFGGIFAFNQPIDSEIAEKLSQMFVEAILAPAFSDDALTILTKKKNVRLLSTPSSLAQTNNFTVKSALGGYLVQQHDLEMVSPDQLEVVTKVAPSDDDLKQLLFAFKVCKHVKSNAIVITNDSATIGIGAGQTSRVDAANIAVQKAEQSETNGPKLKGSYLASDAFFPFADGLEIAANAGVGFVIQPGGSIRDEEVIEAADKHGIAMVLTGQRHFRH